MARHNHSRRRFLRTGSRTLLGAGLALGADPILTLAHAADAPAVDANEYRALVCLYLKGGCDGFSLVVPLGGERHDAYANSRGDLAVGQQQLRPFARASLGHGMHGAAAALGELVDDGRMAIVANVGNLIEPTSKMQYEERAVSLPAQLFSHNDQTIQWMQQQGVNRGDQGWGARTAGFLAPLQERDYLTSISLDGSNHWQSGFGQRPYSITARGVLSYDGMDPDSAWERPRREIFQRTLTHPRRHLFTRTYAELQQRAMHVTTELGQVLEANNGLITEPPGEETLSHKFAMVARLIAAHDTLGMRRQVFYLDMDGFDVHDKQNRELPELFSELADGLAFFQQELANIGMEHQVTTFTASDFGRALTSNGDGTDHGWGNHHLVMGGAVQGNAIYGQVPLLHKDSDDSVQNGRILPTTATAQYAATLLRWIGLDETQLDTALPNLANFGTRDLGFMG
ncbi:MAG: hypothetical protein CSB44_08160 [Gammaproteobacteria bacterium]|nr:MAG: hypothetical protein CSB44_08160 [Gammaproteobacteria bacterium]PIE36898.1 MAG: hypothetical protein CSA54_02900 [Gammaproteobacteria bacterium]